MTRRLSKNNYLKIKKEWVDIIFNLSKYYILLTGLQNHLPMRQWSMPFNKKNKMNLKISKSDLNKYHANGWVKIPNFIDKKNTLKVKV